MTNEVKGRRRGRPLLTDAQRRGCCISVRLTPDERVALEERAAEVGLQDRLGRYLYDRAVSRRVPGVIPLINQEAWSRLGNCAGALTTMALAASVMNLSEVDRTAIESLRTELRAVRLALLGLVPEDEEASATK
jgi:hypothetical protein